MSDSPGTPDNPAEPNSDAPNSDANDASRPVSSWRRPLLVFALTALVSVLSMVFAALVSWAFAAAIGMDVPSAKAAGGRESEMATFLTVFLLASQVSAVALTYIAAKKILQSAQEVLPVFWPDHGARTILLAIVAMFALATAGAMFVYTFDRSAFTSDIKPFADMARTNAAWLLFAAAAIGAPLSEELLFRGLLYGGLRETIAGKTGAAFISSVVWSALHMQYSIYGISLIVLLGLYFAFLREKTGSLVPSIVCHAVYNGMIVLSLMMAPENAFATP